MPVLRGESLRAGLSLLALLLSSAVPSPGLAQGKASAEAVSIEELIEPDAEQQNIFATDDKALRTSVVRSKKDIIDDIPATAPAEFHAWMNDLLSAFERGDLTASSRTIAQNHALPENAVRQLLRSFALVRAHKYDFFGDEAKDVQNRTRLIEIINKGLDQAGRNPLLVQFAAFTIDQANLCDKSLMTLPGAAADRAASFRSIAAVTGCSEPLLGAVKADPSRQVADLAMLSEVLQNQPTLTLWLLRPEVQQHIAPAAQRAFRLAFTRKAIEDAFAVGADARGLALYDALDPGERGAMLADTQDGFTAAIDGIPVIFGAREHTSLTTSLAAAMYLSGRTDEAREIVEKDPKLPSERKLVDCLFRARTAKNPGRDLETCNDGDEQDWSDPNVDGLMLSWALNAPQADPYPMLEAGFSGGRSSGANAPIARFYCSVFDADVAGGVCADARRSVAYNLKPDRYESEEEPDARRALAALNLPEWDSIAARLESERVAGLAAFDDGDTHEAYADRPPIEPIHPPFAQHTLPPELISRRSDKRSDGADTVDWPKGWTALPLGFEPVRWQSEGTRTVAISQSGLLDRGGEVGRGGYWIHLSNDGGKTWGQPLYTGLAARFPYLIEPTSKLPLLKDDHLQIEVTYALLDTSSITYPPVGLRTLRREPNLWLDIPIEALTKDSNGDGLSDLVAAHLAIDGPAGETPFVVGSDAATCKRGEADPVASVRRKVLLMLTGIDEAAIREPIDRAPDAPLLSGLTRPSTGEKWPLFVKGHAADLACMAPLPMPVLVYGSQGENALQRRSPDFRLIELPSLVMNREKSRGYAIWSSGWTGGTIMFWLEGGRWRFATISSWVT